jgi:hypothetical protein
MSRMWKYPFALEHRGRSYRLSYRPKDKRWLLQEWENDTCVLIRSRLVYRSGEAQKQREAWMAQHVSFTVRKTRWGSTAVTLAE